MARAVTITEFKEWAKKPEIVRHLWAFKLDEKEFADDFKDIEHVESGDRTCIVKYFTLSVDTRDMKIWGISFSGVKGEVSVRDSIEGDTTILNELELEFDKIEKEQESRREDAI